MRFRLTYEGELKASGKDPENGQFNKLAEHKQTIRKVFHGQLKRLWETNKFLSDHAVDPKAWYSKSAIPAYQVGTAGVWGGGPIPERLSLSEAIANMYREMGIVSCLWYERNLTCLVPSTFSFCAAIFRLAWSARAIWTTA
jgi:hypothetical protein